MFWPFKKRRKEEIKTEGKYPSAPIYKEVLIQPGKNKCPNCGSYFTSSAGYGDRLKCEKCGKVFN